MSYSVGEVFADMRAGVWIPSTHIKTWVWQHGTISLAETGGSLELPSQLVWPDPELQVE